MRMIVRELFCFARKMLIIADNLEKLQEMTGKHKMLLQNEGCTTICSAFANSHFLEAHAHAPNLSERAQSFSDRVRGGDGYGAQSGADLRSRNGSCADSVHRTERCGGDPRDERGRSVALSVRDEADLV